jgi:hypothetical protein
LATDADGEASRELEGRVAIVSGSASGIGLGDAEALAAHGAAGGQPSGRHLSNLAEHFHRPMRRQQRRWDNSRGRRGKYGTATPRNAIGSAL